MASVLKWITGLLQKRVNSRIEPRARWQPRKNRRPSPNDHPLEAMPLGLCGGQQLYQMGYCATRADIGGVYPEIHGSTAMDNTLFRSPLN